MPGSGPVKIILPAGSKLIKCEKGQSGHLMMPVSDFMNVKSKNEWGIGKPDVKPPNNGRSQAQPSHLVASDDTPKIILLSYRNVFSSSSNIEKVGHLVKEFDLQVYNLDANLVLPVSIFINFNFPSLALNIQEIIMAVIRKQLEAEKPVVFAYPLHVDIAYSNGFKTTLKTCLKESSLTTCKLDGKEQPCTVWTLWTNDKSLCPVTSCRHTPKDWEENWLKKPRTWKNWPPVRQVVVTVLERMKQHLEQPVLSHVSSASDYSGVATAQGPSGQRLLLRPHELSQPVEPLVLLPRCASSDLESLVKVTEVKRSGQSNKHANEQVV